MTRVSDPGPSWPSCFVLLLIFSVSLHEMMRRASSAARAVSGLDVREPEREDTGMAIPTLNWPPDPPSYESVTRQGEIYFSCMAMASAPIHAFLELF